MGPYPNPIPNYLGKPNLKLTYLKKVTSYLKKNNKKWEGEVVFVLQEHNTGLRQKFCYKSVFFT